MRSVASHRPQMGDANSLFPVLAPFVHAAIAHTGHGRSVIAG